MLDITNYSKFLNRIAQFLCHVVSKYMMNPTVKAIFELLSLALQIEVFIPFRKVLTHVVTFTYRGLHLTAICMAKF